MWLSETLFCQNEDGTRYGVPVKSLSNSRATKKQNVLSNRSGKKSLIIAWTSCILYGVCPIDRPPLVCDVWIWIYCRCDKDWLGIWPSSVNYLVKAVTRRAVFITASTNPSKVSQLVITARSARQTGIFSSRNSSADLMTDMRGQLSVKFHCWGGLSFLKQWKCFTTQLKTDMG